MKLENLEIAIQVSKLLLKHIVTVDWCWSCREWLLINVAEGAIAEHIGNWATACYA